MLLRTLQNSPLWTHVLTHGTIFCLAVLTVLRFAPEQVDADVLMNTIMSLQHMTLYYWGQNRLINILPCVVAFIKNPAWNLVCVLCLSSAIFYYFLYALVVAAAKILHRRNAFLEYTTFLMLATAFIVAFRDYAIAKIVFSHIEYPLPALIFVTTGGIFFASSSARRHRTLTICLSLVLLFIAFGTNPALVIPAAFLSAAVAWYRKKIEKKTILFFLFSAFSFLIWTYISKLYGNLPYELLNIYNLTIGAQTAAISIVSALDLKYLLSGLLLFYAYKILTDKYTTTLKEEYYPVLSFISISVMIFSLAWFLFFSCNTWVKLNGFDYRYYTFIVFAILFVFSLHISINVQYISKYRIVVLIGLCLCAMASMLYPSLKKFDFNWYAAFQRAYALSHDAGRLYAGDYWVVWPSVLRDMMHGREAYGLCERGEANGAAARAYILQKIAHEGYAEVLCLKKSVLKCQEQIEKAVGPLRFLDVSRKNAHVTALRFRQGYNTALHTTKEDVLALPTAVGRRETQRVVSTGTPGYVLEGPHVGMAAGRYTLTVYGEATTLSQAYVEVVAHTGMGSLRVFLHHPLESEQKGLLYCGVCTLPEDVRDMEIRVGVGKDDSIALSGYEFVPLETPEAEFGSPVR